MSDDCDHPLDAWNPAEDRCELCGWQPPVNPTTELERLREFRDWVLQLNVPGGDDRRTVSIRRIINRARATERPGS